LSNVENLISLSSVLILQLDIRRWTQPLTAWVSWTYWK